MQSQEVLKPFSLEKNRNKDLHKLNFFSFLLFFILCKYGDNSYSGNTPCWPESGPEVLKGEQMECRGG
jgi:hypothetical protein